MYPGKQAGKYEASTRLWALYFFEKYLLRLNGLLPSDFYVPICTPLTQAVSHF